MRKCAVQKRGEIVLKNVDKLVSPLYSENKLPLYVTFVEFTSMGK